VPQRVPGRVTSLGEFSPTEGIAYFGHFLKFTEVAHILWLHFPRLRLFSNFDKKLFGPHFGQYCSQTHLVTLVPGNFEATISLFPKKVFAFNWPHRIHPSIIVD
jgi:hypothetical protein